MQFFYKKLVMFVIFSSFSYGMELVPLLNSDESFEESSSSDDETNDSIYKRMFSCFGEEYFSTSEIFQNTVGKKLKNDDFITKKMLLDVKKFLTNPSTFVIPVNDKGNFFLTLDFLNQPNDILNRAAVLYIEQKILFDVPKAEKKFIFDHLKTFQHCIEGTYKVTSTLDVSNQKMQYMEGFSNYSWRYVKTINLSNNELREPYFTLFSKHCPKLTTLNLAYNYIKTIDSTEWNILPSTLNSINLSNNKIIHFPEMVILKEGLSINLKSNPLSEQSLKNIRLATQVTLKNRCAAFAKTIATIGAVTLFGAGLSTVFSFDLVNFPEHHTLYLNICLMLYYIRMMQSQFSLTSLKKVLNSWILSKVECGEWNLHVSSNVQHIIETVLQKNVSTGNHEMDEDRLSEFKRLFDIDCYKKTYIECGLYDGCDPRCQTFCCHGYQWSPSSTICSYPWYDISSSVPVTDLNSTLSYSIEDMPKNRFLYLPLGVFSGLTSTLGIAFLLKKYGRWSFSYDPAYVEVDDSEDDIV